jgi:hypothetical protein
VVRYEIKHLHGLIQNAWFPEWLMMTFNTGFLACICFGFYCLIQLILATLSLEIGLQHFVGFAASMATFWCLLELKHWVFFKILYRSFCAEKPNRSAVEFFLKNQQYQGVASKAALERYLHKVGGGL